MKDQDTNNSNVMDPVITYLLNFAYDHHIGYTLIHNYDSTWPSFASPDDNMILINMDWYKKDDVPLIIAHEIGHMLDEDACYLYDESTPAQMKSENRANVKAIDLLLGYCRENDIEFNSSITFLQQFNIPLKYEIVVKNKMIA